MSKVYLGLGSNMGDRREYLNKALAILRNHDRIQELQISKWYETEPVGYVDQDPFLNIVVELVTNLDPYEVLGLCAEIEEELNRVRVIRWGPRTIDVDVLLYDDWTSKDEKLLVPHPRMTERAFVMKPLSDLCPDRLIGTRTVQEIAEELGAVGIQEVE